MVSGLEEKLQTDMAVMTLQDNMLQAQPMYEWFKLENQNSTL